MKLRIISATAKFGFDLGAELETRELGTVEVLSDIRDRYVLQYTAAVPSRQVSALLDALWPLIPEQVEVSERTDGWDACLTLGEPLSECERAIRIQSDSRACAEKWQRALSSMGFRVEIGDIRLVEEDVLKYSGTPRLTLHKLRWYAHRQGINLQLRDDSEYASQLGLFLRDPELQAIPLRGRYPVQVSCDDARLGADLVQRLRDRGFQADLTNVIDERAALDLPIQVVSGPYHSEKSSLESAALRGALADFLQQHGIDNNRFPIQQEAVSSTVATTLQVPVNACKSGRKRPYSGAFPERFRITLVTDEPTAVATLNQRLTDAGFPDIKIDQRPSLLMCPSDASTSDFLPGFAIAWNDAANESAIATVIRQEVKTAMDAATVTDFHLRVSTSCSGGPSAIRIYFPHQGTTDGKLLEKVADASRFNLRLSTPRPDEWNDLLNEFKRWGFNRCETRESTDESSNISFGGAPLELIEKVRETIRRHAGIDLRPNKAWSDSDCDVWFYVPARPGAATTSKATTDETKPTEGSDSKSEIKLPEDLGPQLEHWAFGDTTEGKARAFIEVTAEQVRVGGVVLPRQQGARHDLAPHPSAFSHFCMDRLTALTMEHISTSVLLREPCLLEGETSTSKTSSILYLAALLNQPIVRINLNGQTDTGELIGRFVPQHLILELPLSSQELYASADLLEAETRMILEKARRENRPLTRVEIQQIMAQEEMVSHPWRWEDGLVPQAMKHGWWVLLDEVNLAEPQILERLNSVLEPNPTLVLTECDNSVIGSGGTPVHADFRLFATMNPAEYAGRSVLSPAYRDRWRGYRFVPRPGEGEYLAMLRLLVYGEQPDFAMHGSGYFGLRQEPRYPQFADLGNADDYLEALARFHVALENAVGQGGADSVARIGSRRRERYVFTRRGLLSILEYLASPLCEMNGTLDAKAVRRALLRYYLGRLSSADDRKMVVQLLDAHGIGPNTWTL